MFQNLDIKDKDTRLLTSLYWNQHAAVRCNGEIGKWINIKQGVRQGCVASPNLFIFYMEMIKRNIDDIDASE